MVCEAGQCYGYQHSRRSAQRVTHFEVILTATHLADTTPGGSRIGAQRVVHPFADFMARGGNIRNICETPASAVEVAYRISLYRACERAVIAENTAVGESVRDKGVRHDYVVEQNNR